MKVLIVEDEVRLAVIIGRNLSARGHGVRLAESAEEALLSAAEEWPDVLILDINLPDFSGWEVLRRLDDEDRMRLRVIVISAAEISRKRLAEFNPCVALRKPFPLNSLIRAVEASPDALPANNERTDVE